MILEALIAFDIWVMRTFLGGLPGETISAAAYNSERTGKWGGRLGRPVIDLLFYIFEREHCRKSWTAEMAVYR